MSSSSSKTSSSLKSETLMKLAQRLRLHKPNHSTSNASNPTGSDPSQNVKNRGAVLICLFEGQYGDIRVILTKRSSKLSSYSGEVSLPGGKRDEADANDADTALREAKEEIGLDSSLVEVIALLGPFPAKKNIVVYPVVGILWDRNAFKPVLNAIEVESIFDAPLEMFLKNENRRQEEREWAGVIYLFHFFEYQVENKSHVIWAFTAAVLIHAASIVYQRQPDFEDRQPRFWKRSRQ